MNSSWVHEIKTEFPSLEASKNWILCDAAGGTQVHQSVISAISKQLSTPTANLFKGYPSALETVQGVARAREIVATFFNCNPNEVVFGANMTSITNHIARSIGRQFESNDNIVVTNLDHDGNVSPWVQVANDKNATVRRVDFRTSDCLLDLKALEDCVDENTKIVAVGAAANSCGSLTSIPAAVDIVRKASRGRALVYVDAVHYAPHKLIDVKELGCDFLVCSAYKFYGPHAGLMFGKEKHLKFFAPYKLAACTDLLPGPESCQSSRWETGTASFEAIAGIKATIEYISSIGVRTGACSPFDGLRKKLKVSYDLIDHHETEISRIFLTKVADISNLKVYGVTDVNQISKRTPTFCINMKGLKASELAQCLIDRGVACAAGNFYAINFPKLMKLDCNDGFTRLAFCQYHTLDDICFVINALKDISKTLLRQSRVDY